jgi:hypothetical protein
LRAVKVLAGTVRLSMPTTVTVSVNGLVGPALQTVQFVAVEVVKPRDGGVLAADVALVDLDPASEAARRRLHQPAQLVGPGPRALVGQAQQALEFLRRAALLARQHLHHRADPQPERLARALEHAPCGDRRLSAAGRAPVELKHLPRERRVVHTASAASACAEVYQRGLTLPVGAT